MNLTKFFTKEDRIAGLSITDTELCLVLLNKNKAGLISVKTNARQELAPGDVVAGEIKNQAGFIKALKQLLDKSKLRLHYVIVSLPADRIFTKLYSLPPALRGERLKNSIQLIANFQLPRKPEEIYFDWQSIADEDGRKNEVVVATLTRQTADRYLLALEAAGLRAVALEFRQMSQARALEAKETPQLLLEQAETTVAVSIIKNQTVRFLRLLPRQAKPSISLSKEVEKIFKFYECEDQPITDLWSLADLKHEEAAGLPLEPAPPKLPADLEAENLGDPAPWLASLGAARRGLLPREADHLISLMEIGTERAYERQKTLTFMGLLVKLTVVLAIFFIAAFASVWILMLEVQANFNQQIQSYNTDPVASSANELETRAKDFNDSIAKALIYYQQEPQWSALLAELKILTGPAITITRLELPSPEKPLLVAGVAASRNDLNTYKRLLEASLLIGQVSLPLENLDKKNDIPFSLTFNLADPAAIYPH